MLAIERHFTMTRFVELAQTIAIFVALSRALNADIFPFWAKIDSQIIWILLVRKCRYDNEVQVFVDSICDLHHCGFILEFLLINQKNNFVAHDLVVHVQTCFFGNMV